MIRRKKEGLTWLEFELLADCPISHGIFLRHGGVSPPPFDSLNFGLTQGDFPENVAENKKRALAALRLRHAVGCFQIHGNVVEEVSHSWEPTTECDGLVTKEPDIGLLIQHADCQAAIFYDPSNHVLANIHCGWRGNVQNIYQEATLKMKRLYGCKPENLLVGISPSLGPEAAQFRNFRTELPEVFWQFQVKPEYFDLWEISRFQLLQCGILSHHIEIAKLCTFSTPEDFFSYRRLKQSGRHATIAALRTTKLS